MISNPSVPVLVSELTLDVPLARQLANVHQLQTKFAKISRMEGVHVKKLIVARIPSCGILPPNMMRNFRDHLVRVIDPTGTPHKILIGQRKTERVFSEMQYFKYSLTQFYGKRVQEFGYDQMDIHDVANLFSETAIFISPHGSGMTNIMFMAPGTTVIELITDEWKHDFFKNLAEIYEINFIRVVVPGTKSSRIILGRNGVHQLLDLTMEAINKSPYLSDLK